MTTRKNTKTKHKKYLDKTEKAWQLELKKKKKKKKKKMLEETNQKILAKEGRLKRYQDKTKQYRQNRTFQNNEKIFTNN